MTTKDTKNIIPTRTVTALVNDKPGVLNRITSMLRRRGFNIQSLAVGHSEIDHLSRLTVVVEGGDDIVEKITIVDFLDHQSYIKTRNAYKDSFFI